ncbi:MAG TPA: response regulator [Acidimicrobiales bacterium]|nr:response regulator [Acidimicrobiales bacterium]
MKRVVLADHNTELRARLALSLATHEYEVVGEEGDGNLVIDLVTQTAPDIVVVDLEMPEVGGLDALPALQAAAPDAAVVVYSANLSPIIRTAVERLGGWAVDKAHGVDALSQTMGQASPHS